jgi:NAD(P)-dependent dehydrogenase (short-subunit alcohol dehydrogenase family)
MTEDRTILLTGASSGIGRVAAIALAERGARVVVVGRNPERTKAVAELTGGLPYICDFDVLDDVRWLAVTLLAEHPRIDVLANNAGGVVARRELTVDGFERTFQSNYLAPYLLTRLLLPRLAESGGRVVSTSSVANRCGRVVLDDLNWTKRRWMFGWFAYSTAKLMTNLFVRELAKRSTVPAYAFHPGFVRSDFGLEWGPMRLTKLLTKGNYGISSEKGAEPLIHLAGSDTIDHPSGTYFHRMKAFGKQARQANDEQLAEALWDRTSELLGLPPGL